MKCTSCDARGDLVPAMFLTHIVRDGVHDLHTVLCGYCMQDLMQTDLAIAATRGEIRSLSIIRRIDA